MVCRVATARGVRGSRHRPPLPPDICRITRFGSAHPERSIVGLGNVGSLPSPSTTMRSIALEEAAPPQPRLAPSTSLRVRDNGEGWSNALYVRCTAVSHIAQSRSDRCDCVGFFTSLLGRLPAPCAPAAAHAAPSFVHAPGGKLTKLSSVKRMAGASQSRRYYT